MLLSNSFKIKMWVNFFRQINVFFWIFSNGVAPKGADRVESENWSQIRETNNSNACFLADSRSKCDLFSFFFQVTNQHGQKSGKSAISESHRLCIFFPESDSIISRIEFKRKKNLAIGFQPTYLNFEILFSHDFFSMVVLTFFLCL